MVSDSLQSQDLFQIVIRNFTINNRFVIIKKAKVGDPPQIEEGVSLDYLIDRNKYIYFGGIKPKEVTKETKLSKILKMMNFLKNNIKRFLFFEQI